MSESNKVVIKINYQGDENKERTIAEPKIIKEWRIKRLLMALAILLIVILFFVYYFAEEEKVGDVPDVKVETQKTIDSENIAKPTADQEIKTIRKVKTVDKQHTKKNKSIDVKPNALINIKDKIKKSSIKPVNSKIVRALLTLGLNKKEPLDSISSYITVNKNKATGVYYFTEIIDMKGESLTHEWLWNNQTVYKKKFNILGRRWRAATSKLIPYSKAGLWTVRLINEKGDYLNEIKFEVIKE